ncbi:MAG: Xaa-Pro peptidase family protein [Bacillota bacterium]
MTPQEELSKRIKKIQEKMQKDQIAGALIVQRADLFYFSGTGQNGHLLIPAENEPTLVIKKSLARAEQESALEKIVPFLGWDELTQLIKDNLPPGQKVGLETDVLPANLYFRYEKMLADYEIVDISKQIRKLRAVKSDYEIKMMEEASRISNSVFNHAAKVIQEGMSEVELASHLEHHARTLGHQGMVRMRGFNQEMYYGHIMSGDNAAALTFFDGPTGGPGLNPSFPQGAGISPIKRHEPILIDFVSVLAGYMVDQTRIFSLSKPAMHLLEAYQQAVNIKKSIAEMAKPGVTCATLFARAEEMAERAGLNNHFMGYVEKINFIGHGVGLELDELPVLARNLELPLEEGMVFALEPKFIFPSEGAVGIEDTFVVNVDRSVQLTGLNDKLQIL